MISMVFIHFLFGCSSTCSRDTASDGPPAQTFSTLKAKYHKISAAKAHKMMSESKDFILLDVRTDEEYREQRIEGAVLLPDFEITDRAEKELPDKNKLMFVYCRSGRRSESASKVLVSLGYTQVFDIGGILNWPYETIGGQ